MRNSLAKFEDLQVRLAARLGNSERRNTPRVITVTSCLEREGVTTVAVGLAAVFAAKIGSRVLFVNLAPQRNGWDKKLALTRLGEVDPLNELEVYTEGQKQIQAAGHADLAGSGLLKDSGAGAGTDLRSRPSTCVSMSLNLSVLRSSSRIHAGLISAHAHMVLQKSNDPKFAATWFDEHAKDPLRKQMIDLLRQDAVYGVTTIFSLGEQENRGFFVPSDNAPLKVLRDEQAHEGLDRARVFYASRPATDDAKTAEDGRKNVLDRIAKDYDRAPTKPAALR